MPVKEEEVGEKFIRYWNCPSLFIPNSIHSWYKMYQYHLDFPGASMKSVDDQNPRFLSAYRIYSGHMSEIEAFKEKTKGM